MAHSDEQVRAAGDGEGPAPSSSAAGPGGCFRVFSDRTASDLEAFEWNASMDLLACLTAPPDSTMSIYRLLSEDQSPKLLSEKITGTGTALCWSPCGRRVAVGDRLGGVSIYDGESGAVLHARRPHERPVVALAWAEAAAGGAVECEAPWSRMLPPLLAVPSAPSNMYAEAPEAEVEPNAGGGFSLLVSCDEGGLVVISANGTFPVQATHLFSRGPPSPLASPCAAGLSSAGLGARVPLPEVLEGQPVGLAGRRPTGVRLSPDLRCLAVLLGPPGSGLSEGCPQSPRSPPAAVSTPSCGSSAPLLRQMSAGNAPALADASDEVVLVLDVRKLAVRRRELAQCSGMVERLQAVLGYAQQAVDLLAHVWRGAAEGFANKVRGLSEAIEAYRDAEHTSVHEELVRTCCTGSPSDAVHSFLTRQTSPQQLVRLERTLMQALEYVNLVVCTRLQVAGSHILTILHELHACASWTQKFKSLGLEVEPLRLLTSQTQDFSKMTELLLIECSQARRFVHTLFRVLLRLAQQLSDQPTPASEAGAAAPSKEDLDDFVARMQQRQSLELAEVTDRIGKSRGKGPGTAAGSGAAESPAAAYSGGPAPASLAGALQRLAAGAERVGAGVAAALASHASLLACVPVRAPSPWASVAVPDLRAAASSDLSNGVMPPRGLGHSTLSLTWEEPEQGQLGGRLLLLWSGGGGREAELHLCRIHIEPAPPSAPVPPRLDRLRLRAGGLLAAPGAVAEAPAHFLLCQTYDQHRIATVVLQEQATPSGGTQAVVCLVDLSEQEFEQVDGSGVAATGELPAPARALRLEELPEGRVKRSGELPASYAWVSAMRVMASRGVCSLYAWRARRLLTLDMQAEGDDDDDEDDAGD